MPPIYNELFAAMEQKDVFMFLSELRSGSFFLNLLFTGWCILGVNHFATKKCYNANEVALAVHIIITQQ